MIIRDAVKEEIPFIREQRLRAYYDHKNVIPEDHFHALQKAISSDADSQSGVELIVAEEDGIILGSVALFPPNSNAYEGFLDELDHAEIRLLAVDPAARGQGVGKALVTECIQRTKQKDQKAIGLHTGEFMNSAIVLYKSLGFVRCPEYDFEPANDGIIVKAFKLELT
ncbi:GNAT family N-acetyltransferase [Litchfieldia salsa]|uniref:N-acetylglutamate synthase, GNAT family n=1 Tax=Litchfieldia salsa TaxID=930152 RepID=A0A1H0PRE9_9BACI|nr:GNAT family N-acetyltransferase [Litchfieldia salsa]SDP07139.1 N-acetylglutamate synthase, GNAT family [Litchfieldia salsa]